MATPATVNGAFSATAIDLSPLNGTTSREIIWRCQKQRRVCHSLWGGCFHERVFAATAGPAVSDRCLEEWTYVFIGHRAVWALNM